MSDDRLTEKLAARVLGWKAVGGRFLKPNRAWTPSWKFAPLTSLDHAFKLLENAFATYTLSVKEDRTFTAEVTVAGHTGKASGEPKARAISIALADALGIAVADDLDSSASSQERGDSRSRRASRGL